MVHVFRPLIATTYADRCTTPRQGDHVIHYSEEKANLSETHDLFAQDLTGDEFDNKVARGSASVGSVATVATASCPSASASSASTASSH
ncbi:hypothetical protein C5C66_01990 [Rathayibacter toxicus]|nr:hypothetical protein C5D15_01970 [Rathayibacter toxicus]PPG47624.1 hypothetical protein C5D16_01965 [Rathayibacter toxicus]PPH64495.1 hypothetical protein C5D13_02010 [Rathayibacter toxicus]PPH68687.1 hypothetical protein C5D01_02000 [Rathayibacter toxicus]PPH73543.1 hypothetical protein C5D24_01930 [Rathayibacter toxicus]